VPRKSKDLDDWRRLGMRLHVSRNTLLTALVSCDVVLPKTFTERIGRLTDKLAQIKSDFEDEMFERTNIRDTTIFYPGAGDHQE